jgi:hypothetical protein
MRVDHALADHGGDVCLEDQKGDEVEERGPDDGVFRGEDARRDDGGDRVCRVVETIDEIEDKRNPDHEDDDREVAGGFGGHAEALETPGRGERRTPVRRS